jgi:hypothetical protein
MSVYSKGHGEKTSWNPIGKIVKALNDAFYMSFKNVVPTGKRILIALDVSGSMCSGSQCNKKGTSPIEIAAIFAAAVWKANAGKRTMVTIFSDRADHIDFGSQKDQSVMGLANYLISRSYGGGTNLASALNKKSGLGFEPKSVIVFSDMQVNSLTGSYGWGGHRSSESFPDVSKHFSKECVKIAFNLEAYDSTPMSVEQGFYQLAGYSDKVFNFIKQEGCKESAVDLLSNEYVAG